jgi:hypothetical protein
MAILGSLSPFIGPIHEIKKAAMDTEPRYEYHREGNFK